MLQKSAFDSPPVDGKRARRRDALLDAMADHLLAHGLAGSSLRALAEAAGTSDRMLLYYFADRDALLTALLDHVAGRMTARLGALGPAAPRPADALLTDLWAAARTPAFRPSMLLFLELAAAAGRGEQPHRRIAARIAQGFAAWVADRLDGDPANRPARAYRLLATLDGLFLLYGAGLEDEANAVAGLGG